MTQELPSKMPASADLKTPDATETGGQGWNHVDQLLDEALQATFPASDAVAVGH
jgi:hypothetical protein